MARILIAAGASGGHVYPALATAEVLRTRGHDVQFAGGDRLEARVVPDAGFVFHPLPVRRPPSKRVELVTPRGIAAVAAIGWSTVRAISLLRRLRPDVVLGMGGFASVPVTLAAARARCALVLHEQNAHLSFAQRIPLRWADVLAQGLPIEEGVTHPRTEVIGNPVRRAVASLAELDTPARAAARGEARTRLGLDAETTTLFVLGGSLGSGPLNETVPTLPMPPDVQVLHLAGSGRDAETRSAWQRSDVRNVVVGYLDTMEDAYLAADLVIARSGASTVAELALAALPSILVPLPTLARGDQAANARVLERAGAAVIVSETDASFAERLSVEVTRLLADAAHRDRMSAAARTVARPDAAERLAEIVSSASER